MCSAISMEKEKKYNCGECEESFFKFGDLENHMIDHKPKCKNCKRTFNSERDKIKHSKGGCKRKTIFCTNCQFNTTKTYEMFCHVDLEHNGSGYKCHACNHISKTRYLYYKHNRSYHEGKILRCHICSFEAANVQSLRKHTETIHSETRRFSCNKCKHKYVTSSDLRQHKYTHNRKALLGCDKCDFKLSNRGCLNKHVLLKHEGVRYTCDLCYYQATSKPVLKIHKLSYHEGFTYNCNMCDFKALRSGQLNPSNELRRLENHKKKVHKKKALT